jgi:hypothetical protein
LCRRRYNGSPAKRFRARVPYERLRRETGEAAFANLVDALAILVVAGHARPDEAKLGFVSSGSGDKRYGRGRRDKL